MKWILIVVFLGYGGYNSSSSGFVVETNEQTCKEMKQWVLNIPQVNATAQCFPGKVPPTTGEQLETIRKQLELLTPKE